MINVLKTFGREKCKITPIDGIALGAIAVVSIGCFLYKKLRKPQPKLQMVCCNCLDDEGLEALYKHFSDMDDYYDDEWEEDSEWGDDESDYE